MDASKAFAKCFSYLKKNETKESLTQFLYVADDGFWNGN